MTTEELRTYLVIRRFDEDVVQDVIVDFLTTTIPIRYPKAWGWKAAQRYTAAWRRTKSRHIHLETLTDEYALNPEQLAEVKEELARAFEHGRPPKRKRGRPRNDGFRGCQEDYWVLKHGK